MPEKARFGGLFLSASERSKRNCAFRLRGVDTPELGQPRADAARQRLQQLLNSGTVTVEPKAVVKYGRTVAVVRVNGQDVSSIDDADQLIAVDNAGVEQIAEETESTVEAVRAFYDGR